MSEGTKDGIAITAVILVVIVLIIAGILGLVAGIKAFGRSQARADAHNQVSITHIAIERAQQEADINHAQIKAQEAEAQKRVVEAHGIAEATKIVDATLTPLYVQHEAIQAQKEIATSGQNNTVIYVPAGTNGTPLITQDAQAHKPETATVP